MLKKVLFAFLTIAIILGGYFAYKKFQTPKSYAELEAERIAKVIKQDKKTLDNSKAHEADVYGALIRLSSRGEKMALQESLKRAKDPSTLVRAAVGNALGYFDDPEALQMMERLSNDPEIQVRVQAINGIAHKDAPPRIELLKRVVGRASVSPEEWVAAYSGLLVMSVSPQEKTSAVVTLIGMSSNAKLAENLRNLAAIKLISVAPRDEKVVKMMKDVVLAGKNRALVPVSLRHLSTMNLPGMADVFVAASKNEDAQVRIAALQGMRYSCHPKRFNVAEHFIRQDKERYVKDAAIRELQWMPSDESLAVLERVIKDHALEDDQERLVRITATEVRRLKGQPGSHPCAK